MILEKTSDSLGNPRHNVHIQQLDLVSSSSLSPLQGVDTRVLKVSIIRQPDGWLDTSRLIECCFFHSDGNEKIHLAKYPRLDGGMCILIGGKIPLTSGISKYRDGRITSVFCYEADGYVRFWKNDGAWRCSQKSVELQDIPQSGYVKVGQRGKDEFFKNEQLPFLVVA